MQAGCYVDISLGCAVFSPYTGAAFAFSEEALTMPASLHAYAQTHTSPDPGSDRDAQSNQKAYPLAFAFTNAQIIIKSQIRRI